MGLPIRLCTAIVLFLALVFGAGAIEIGGGTGARVGADSSSAGSFQADSTGASSDMSSSGTVPGYVQDHFVEDATGKRAEMSLNVTGAVGTVGYKASFVPKEGNVSEATTVSASQTVKVAKADSIVLHTAAKSSGPDVACVNLTIARVDTPASFTGSTLSRATATSALAQVQGQLSGAIRGSAGIGGNISGPYNFSKSRDSLGQKVEGTVVMQAESRNGNGAFSGLSRFTVNPTQKVQAAINASWDGDIINVARGTYRENLALDKNITVKGAGSSKTLIDGMQKGSVMEIGLINNWARVNLSGLAIQNGSADNGGGIFSCAILTVTDSKISWNTGKSGGGICSSGTLSLIRSQVSENSGIIGGGISNYWVLISTKSMISANRASKYGGGIYNNDRAILSSSTVSMNDARSYGGGIYSDGSLDVTSSKVSGNSAETAGGICNDEYGTMNVTGSTVSGNNAYDTGGIYSYKGTMNVAGSTISGNTGFTYGGGIHIEKGIANIARSAISGNTAYDGGGVYSNGGTTTITGSKITGNKACKGGGELRPLLERSM